VEYNPDICESFGDVVAWDPEAQAAFSHAANLWGTLLTTSQTIVIHACWLDMGESSTLGSASTADIYQDFTNAPVAGTLYPVALANSLAGDDLNDDEPEIYASFNSAAEWYFGTDGNSPKDKNNFVHVVLHELAHGLGFNSALEIDGGVGKWLNSSPGIFEHFTEDQAGVNILDSVVYPNNSAALATALQSNALFFSGIHAKAAFGNRRVPLYAPDPYEPSSSHGHLATSFEYSADNLMLPKIDRSTRVPHPGSVTLGILRDLGWEINDDGGPDPFLLTHPEQVVVTGTVGSIEPAALLLTLFAHRPDAGWSVEISSVDGWLATSTPTGSGSGVITLTADVAGLAPGYYAATITVSLVDHPAVKSIIPAALLLDAGLVSAPNLLQSGDMESGQGWDASSENVIIGKVTINGKNVARSGTQIALLGVDNNDVWDLAQTVSIPDAESATLVYYSLVDSSDQCGYDHAEVRINGTPVAQQTLCARTTYDGWRANVIDLGAYLNQMVTISFHVENDSSQMSRLYLDDISLLVMGVEPTLTVSPTSLSFLATEGGATPPAQSLTILSAGAGASNWVAEETIPWVTLSATSGVTPAEIEVLVNPAALTPGQVYSGNLSVSLEGLAETTQVISITLVYDEEPAAPILSVTPASLAFTIKVGSGEQLTRTLAVQNNGGSTLTWQASEAIPWLSLSNESGTAPSTVNVLVSAGELAAGSYSGTITIIDSNDPESSQEITVQLTVEAEETPFSMQNFLPLTANR
jgi:hypothetical protein